MRDTCRCCGTLGTLVVAAVLGWALPLQDAALRAQTGLLEQQLLQQSAAELAAEARKSGDAHRGAIVFFQAYMACTRCHTAGENGKPLGPDLTRIAADKSDAYLVDAVLRPSKEIAKGYEPIVLTTAAGKTVTGILESANQKQLVLRDVAQNGKRIVVPVSQIEQRSKSPTSIMPTGLVNPLASRQQFLDLVRYLIEVKQGGPSRALALKPPASLYSRPLPEYEKAIDHAGMIAGLNRDHFRRGEAIYNRLCINCHGDHQRPGSLPTSLRFAEGKFKNGSDPYTMYQTLTKGFGMMVPQAWMVPKQKYDVIHYIREAYLKDRNPSQYFAVNSEYLASLPAGDTQGPEPSQVVPWEQMDYGPNLVGTYEIGKEGSNFAYKGNAIRLDDGPGGVSQGRHWMLFDYDTLRVAAAWNGKGFIDWNGIHFNGRHNIHPRIAGTLQWENPTGPGWADPRTGSFEDTRLVGRDGRRYGPLPRRWAHYKGMYYHGNKTVIAYTVGTTEILEQMGRTLVPPHPVAAGSTGTDTAKSETEPRAPSSQGSAAAETTLYTRTLNLGPRAKALTLQVAHRGSAMQLQQLPAADHALPVALVAGSVATRKPSGAALRLDGSQWIEVAEPDGLDLTAADYSIVARLRTRKGGTILAQTARGDQWVPDGKTLFIRNGRLCFDIGWVGVVQSDRRVDDNQWHDVAMTYDHKRAQVRLFVDGKESALGTLKPKAAHKNFVLRIAHTAANFPRGQSSFVGDLAELRVFQRKLSDTELGQLSTLDKADETLRGHWKLTSQKGDRVVDFSDRKLVGRVVRGTNSAHKTGTALLAGVVGNLEGGKWEWTEAGDLRLHIPAGRERLQVTVWTTSLADPAQASSLLDDLVIDDDLAQDLRVFTRGGPARWPGELVVPVQRGKSEGPFAIDVLTHPLNNPWFCRMRLSGFDFYPDGDRMAICDWDGNVWLIRGLSALDSDADNVSLTWRRIASGLFQPLGLKIVNGQIYVSCRDQICILHDQNGDGEMDWIQNFNNDHQVTDHFHEFAMGLQVDAEGNFYYAKSARHALKALVPHHGTLLKVSKDGERTQILATGFRAANGVCLNPDGSFIVTDQEGHWNPKNRINWVTPGGFYGNMFGYHDVTDDSDSAMQPPLCWITNAFDRSPAELLWVDSPAWGPLQGSLLNFSYGYGKVYVVPHEKKGGQMQGGMCALPIPQFPTGVMRGRFHPGDGQLYTCGMFAWAGSQQSAGGLYRVRYTGKPVHLPVELKAEPQGMRVSFSGPVDRSSASDPRHYAVKVWSLKRTANYGSKHYDEHPLEVRKASVADDGRSVFLELDGMQPTWCMEIKYAIKTAEGRPLEGVIHNTVHKLSDQD